MEQDKLIPRLQTGGTLYKTPNEYQPVSGTYKVPTQVKPETLAKGLITGAGYLGQLGLINKSRRVQQGRNMRMLTPVQTSVRSETDIPSETLAERQGQISRVRSQYKGSDPAMKLISDLSSSAQRGALRDKLASDRGTNLIAERNRVASETAANQLRAGEIQHKNIERNQALDDYKLQSDVNALTHKKKLLSQSSAGLLDSIESGQAFNLKGEQIAKQEKIAAIDTDISFLNMQKTDASRLGYSIAQIRELNDQLEAKKNERNLLLNQPTQKAWTKIFKTGGKLISR